MEKLQDIWHNVRYLVIDEISMVSAQFLSQISEQINLARQCPSECGTMFGNISVIFTGDMGQLKPVKALPLFSHELVKDLRIETVQSVRGQAALHGAYIWRQVTNVIELRKNMRQSEDSLYADLLNRIRAGKATSPANSNSHCNSSDTAIIADRELGVLKGRGTDLSRFRDAPIIVGSKAIRDANNRVKTSEYAQATGQELFNYCSKDRVSMVDLSGDLRDRAWRIRSSLTGDSLGRIPMVPGMKLMVTENIAIQNKLVNGAEGTLHSIKYDTDADGNRYLLAAYLHVPECGLVTPGLPVDVVPIMPVRSGFTYRRNKYSPSFYISRLQVPLVPSYCYTDYKSQGCSLQCAIVDLTSARSLQGVYVMLSHVKSLEGLAILRWFEPNKVQRNLSEEIRNEFKRLTSLACRAASSAQDPDRDSDGEY
jgi:ATP-dependent DNA helicase PIF1